MKRASPLLLPALAALAGCAADRSEPVSLARSPLYQAVGGPPGWTLAVARGKIVLRLSPEHSAGGDAAATVWKFPSPRASFAGGVKTWEAGTGTQVISIEARRAPCRSGGTRFQDEVRVRLSGRELSGCGGRILPEGTR